jgi:hypothetical protein
MAKRAIVDQPLGTGHGQILTALAASRPPIAGRPYTQEDVIDETISILSNYFDNPVALRLPIAPDSRSALLWIANGVIYALRSGTVDTLNWNDLYTAGPKALGQLAPGRNAVQVFVAATPFTNEDQAKIRSILNVSFDGERDSEIIALKPEDSISYPYYDKTNKKTELITLKMRQGARAVLHNAGYLRFDTVLVRNIIWLTNLQRLTRLALRRELFWHDTKVVSRNAVTSSGVTELYGNDLTEVVKPGYNPYVPYRY